MRLVILLVLVTLTSTDAQFLSIKGRVQDFNTGEVLSFTNIRVAGTAHGTSANREGKYELKLFPGNYKLIASYIGYISDTLEVELKENLYEVDFRLRQTNIILSEITIKPGENPALEIIRKSIARKIERNKKLTSFEFEAYTKGTIRTEEDISSDRSSLSLSLGTSDSTDLMITGIIENQSKGYFKKPDKYKEVISARKQSANFPSSVNVLTGGRLIQNFYEDDISFMGINLPGPLASNALDYYYFQIQNIQLIDEDTVFRIQMTPDRETDPGFTGFIYIKDSSFDLIRVDLKLNRAANRGGIFDTIDVFQQFAEFGSGIYMPVDYRLYAVANVLNLARFGFELSTILFEYKINPEIPNDFFDKAVVTVKPDADQKDSLYWADIQSIPNTREEQRAYKRIDSLKNVPVTFWDKFSPLSSRINLSDKIMISAPIAMYHFNRVEGNALDFGIFTEDMFNSRFNSSMEFSYGFADKRVKSDYSGSYLFGIYRTGEIKVNAYNKIKVLFGESDNYNELTSTLLALLSKYEFRDYYYSKGFDVTVSNEITPVLELSGGFINYTDKSAFNNSDFSFFAREREYKINPPVSEVSINALKAGFTLDFRNYIEDGFFRRRISQGKSYITISGNITHSNKNLLNSSSEFTRYDMSLRGNLKSFGSTAVLFRLFGMYTMGSIPLQDHYALPGNINLIAQDFTFRTLNINEVLGDKVITLNIENYLRDEIFRFLNIPVLKTSEIQLKTFLNIAYAETNLNQKDLLPPKTFEFKSPFYEAGFGLGHFLFPLQIEFAWKLNHRGNNNFRIGINSFVF